MNKGSKTVSHTDCRVLFLGGSHCVSKDISRVLTENQRLITTGGEEQCYGLYAHIASANGVMQYSTTKKQELIGVLYTPNKNEFVSLCSQMSHILGSMNSEEVKHEKETQFRILLEYVFRSGLKVRRDVCTTGKIFDFQQGCLIDEQGYPSQIDELRNGNTPTPTVVQYAERKIGANTEDAITEMYVFLQRRFGDEFVSHAFQQAGTFATEMYEIRTKEMGVYLGPEMIFDKN